MAGLKDVIESTLGKVVGASAPLLGAALGSPIAGVLVSLLANAFGVSSGKVEDVRDAILGDAEAASKLKALELAHSESLAKIASNDYATEVSDRINARANAVMYKGFLIWMAFIVTVGFFAAMFLLFVPMEISELQRTLLSMLVGMLASKWQTIIDFFFGSSHIHRQGETNGSHFSK